MTLTKILRDANVNRETLGRTATVHGFRSTFRDWASEQGYPCDLAERALAHTVKNAVEAAYHRTDLLEQRRGMMEALARPAPHFPAGYKFGPASKWPRLRCRLANTDGSSPPRLEWGLTVL